MQDWKEYANVVTELFVIVDPVAAVPVYISLMREQSHEEKRRTPRLAALTVAIVLVTAALIGESLLTFFGVSIHSFRVAGGLLLLFMAIAMLHARLSRTQRTPDEAAEAVEKESIAVVPLAIPLLAGPGAISTVMIYTAEAENWFDRGFLILASLFVAVCVWLALSLANTIRMHLGKTGINILIRLMGLVLAAIAIEFMAAGLGQLLPGLSAR
jgi:multiple antibiotic resistance protein